MDSVKDNYPKSKLKSKIVIVFLLLLIVSLAFFIRVYFCYNLVYSDGLVKYNDDGMYHMRNLENLLLGGHFPSSMRFDPYLNFPHGTYIGMAPLFDLILAVIIWLISFGKPTIELINKVAPFYPAVLGSLIPIVIYFFTKALWNDEKVSLISAFFVAITSPILYKSLLGANDHHVLEVLLSSLSLMFLFYALRAAKKGTSIRNKKLWFFILMTGFSMGIYLLTWPGAILFLFIIFVFLSIYYLMEFISKKPAYWILAAGALIFLIPLLMTATFFGHPDINSGIYNINQLLCFFLGFLVFLVSWVFSFFIKRKSLNRWLLILFLIAFFIIFLIFLKIAFPYIFEKLLILSNGVNDNANTAAVGYKNLVSEMGPMNFQGAIGNYSSLFFLYLLGFFIIVYKFFKEKKPEYLLLTIWTMATFLITGIIPFFGQLRFGYYLAVNVAILAGFVVAKGFEFGRKSLNISSRLDKESPLKTYFLVGSILILFNLVFFLIYPFPFNAGLTPPQSLPYIVLAPLETAQGPYILGQDWYQLLKWLREKTPDPGVSFYALYPEPGINKKTGKINSYPYPPQAYGVLAPWDFGYAIAYYGHRIAIATPGQQGIGKKVDGKVTELGEGVFFLETDEDKAAYYLDQLKAKYVLTSSNYAILDTGFFDLMIKWVQGNMEGYINEPIDSPTKYDNSMIARLHLLDGGGTVIENKVDGKNIDLNIAPLKHFRLLYESATTVRILPYKDVARDIKDAKAFEYVKGAEITGTAPNGAKVSISTEVTTNQGRKFTYEEDAYSENNSFDFIVPYSTQKQEMSDVSAEDYTIKAGDYVKKIKVSEEDVLQGKTVQVNF